MNDVYQTLSCPLVVAVLCASVLPDLATAATTSRVSARKVNEFPEDFLFGAGTSSYQVEGGSNLGGKGENIWDRLLHSQPNYTTDGRNADVAADSYHKYMDDVAAVASMGGDVYRFSVSWARILPAGDLSYINKEGIEYYSNLIDGLQEKGITPMITMYHFDLPQKLQDMGGWPNPFIADYFVDYAKVLFDNLGHKVKWWVTFNQPDYIAQGYTSTSMAPALNTSGIGDYMCGYTILLAHARTWHLYNDKYRAKQKGKVGITLNIDWQQAASDSEEDIAAAERSLQFGAGCWAHPILTKEGDYPAVVRQRVAANSKAEGRTRSRLPPLSPEEINLIKGTADFLGLNHYTTFKVSVGEAGAVPSKERDTGAVTTPATEYPLTPGSGWLRTAPMGLRKTLNWLSKNYPGTPIIITENGCSDDGTTLDDQQRINYLRCYLSELLRAMNVDGIKVIGYVVWSLIDNFEWEAGYTSKFGLFAVDFDDPERPRVAKSSVAFMKEVSTSNGVPLQYFATDTSQSNSSCYDMSSPQTTTTEAANKKRASHRQVVRTVAQRGSQRGSRNRGKQANPVAAHITRSRSQT